MHRHSIATFFRYNIVIVAILSVTIIGAAEPKQVDKKPAASIKELRKQAANRQRRLIVNNDGNEPVKELKNITAEEILALRTSPVVGTKVDSIFYCSWSSGFGLFTHFTKIGGIFTSTEAWFAHNRMADFTKAGLDPLKLVVDFSKKNNIEVFWSMRMNDTHDRGTSDYGPVLFAANKLKNSHPEYLLGSYREKLLNGSWSSVDYSRPEIRELAFRYFEEVCLNYNIDGFEMDFFRHPVFFKATTRGNDVTDKERSEMTELLRRIRTMADEVGKKRGRPILISARTPDSVEYARAIGLDIEKWMQDDLIDLYMPASYFQLNEWKYSVDLGHKYGVKVYPSLDESRVDDKSPNKMRSTYFALRARAANVWASGADGVYLFNFFNFDDSAKKLLNEISDPKALAKLDKDYFASYIGAKKAAGGNLSYNKHINVETLTPQSPKSLEVGKPVTAKIHVFESADKNGQSGQKKATLKLRLQLSSPVDPNSLAIHFNDKPLKQFAAAGNWLETELDPAVIKNGENQVSIAMQKAIDAKKDAKDDEKKLLWTDMLIEVRH